MCIFSDLVTLLCTFAHTTQTFFGWRCGDGKIQIRQIINHGVSPNRLSKLLTTLVIPNDAYNVDNTQALARVGISGPAFYLLRPDGHVGLCGVRLDMAVVTGYFSKTGIL